MIALKLKPLLTGLGIKKKLISFNINQLSFYRVVYFINLSISVNILQ